MDAIALTTKKSKWSRLQISRWVFLSIWEQQALLGLKKDTIVFVAPEKMDKSHVGIQDSCEPSRISVVPHLKNATSVKCFHLLR